MRMTMKRSPSAWADATRRGAARIPVVHQVFAEAILPGAEAEE
jgi:hypothetical protein